MLPLSPLSPAAARRWGALLLLLAIALGVRLYAAQEYGRDWYGAESFTLINFDEGGSCRAALEGFTYTPFVGYQTLWIADRLGAERDPELRGDSRAVKAFCHAETHIAAARSYSAVTGALTIVALFMLSLQLFPGRRDVALGASALLALSGWHMSESLMGTVDAPSTFFTYAFLVAALSAMRGGGWRWPVAGVLLLPAIWTKYWVFALLSLLVLMPPGIYAQLLRGLTGKRVVGLVLAYALLFGLVSNPAMPEIGRWILPVAFYLLPPWRHMSLAGRGVFLLAPWLAPLAMQIDVFVAFTSGGLEGRFGTEYGAIGGLKIPRNLINVPIVLLMGLGLPAFIAMLAGIYSLGRRREFPRAWLVLLPLPAFLLFMALLAPVTYYRHYLPLLPAACLLAALGLSQLSAHWRRVLWPVALVWQLALATDLVSDYFLDPRRALPDWYAEHQPTVVMSSFYVNPPVHLGAVHRLFRESYARGDAARLRLADTVILSENWYDTAFANELNGPFVGDPKRLIKTRPQAVEFYRSAIADEHPRLEQVAYYPVPSFMPEMLIHRLFYGSFTQFVGDIRVYRVIPE